jgi:hypothetical protein
MEYQFRTLGKQCAASGRPLEPGEECISVLAEQKGQLVRLDYAAAAWKGPPEGAIGQWRSQVPQAVQVNAARVDPEVLLQFFEQMVEGANAAHDRLIYVLALYLLQRRRLKLEGSGEGEDGSPSLELIGSRGEGPYRIRDQQLPEDEVRILQSELNRQLAENWLNTEAA